MTRTAYLALAAFAAAAIAFSGNACAGTTKQAPEFSVKLIPNGQTDLAAFKGRPLVLNFSASWCPHCIHEMPALKAVSDARKADAAFLVVFVNSPKKDVDAAVKKYGLKCAVGFDADAASGKAYGVRGIPATFFIDKDGNIVDQAVGSLEEDELNKKVDGLVKAGG